MNFLRYLLTIFALIFSIQSAQACTTPKANEASNKLNHKTGSPFKPTKKSSPLRASGSGAAPLAPLSLNAFNLPSATASTATAAAARPRTIPASLVDHKANAESRLPRLALRIADAETAAAPSPEDQLDAEIIALQIDDLEADVVTPASKLKAQNLARQYTANTAVAVAQHRINSPAPTQNFLDQIQNAFNKSDFEGLIALSKRAPDSKSQAQAVMYSVLCLERMRNK